MGKVESWVKNKHLPFLVTRGFYQAHLKEGQRNFRTLSVIVEFQVQSDFRLPASHAHTHTRTSAQTQSACICAQGWLGPHLYRCPRGNLTASVFHEPRTPTPMSQHTNTHGGRSGSICDLSRLLFSVDDLI